MKLRTKVRIVAAVVCLMIGSQTVDAEPDFTAQPDTIEQVSERSNSDTEQPNKESQSDTSTIDGTTAGSDAPPKPDKFVIATWGGAYKKAQELAYFQPFRNKTSHEFSVQIHSGGLSELKSPNYSEDHSWDVVDLSRLSLREACEQGLLEELNPTDLDSAPDGTPAAEDFLPDGIHRCGIGSMAWSFAIVFDKTKFKKKFPASIEDFFDVKKFPGRRSLPKHPQYTLELALLSDGVAPDSVYSLLETEEGLQRAFSALDKLKDRIVWWSKGFEPFAHLNDKTAVMATAFNGRIFTEVATNRTPLEIIWDGQIYDTVFWSVPKSSQNKKKAIQFIKFATSPTRMAQQSMLYPYGPLRKSAIPLVGKHTKAGIRLDRFLPTHPDNLKNALRFESRWWQQHEKRIEEKFENWLNGNSDALPDQDLEKRN